MEEKEMIERMQELDRLIASASRIIKYIELKEKELYEERMKLCWKMAEKKNI